MDPLRIFVGYDQVEAEAYHTLVQSIIETATVPVSITPLKLSMLPMYQRARDPKQSNEFSFSRFLVPYLCDFQGQALFIDCDMMFRTDPRELFDLFDGGCAVQVVKHHYTPKTKTKYLGNVQYPYPRKNWSSVMLFNCGHPDCSKLTPHYINTAEPAWLHRFYWTSDDSIGGLPIEWNHLVGEYAENPDAKLVHWTIGGPYFDEYMDTEFAEEWRKVNYRMRFCAQSDDVERILG